MDRSFLTDELVVHASRNFVCLRLATYEDAEEAVYLKKLFARNGRLENTVFGIISSDGKQPLVRTGRSPSFRNATNLAAAMDRIIQSEYPAARKQTGTDPNIPEMKNLDLGLNVASCDGLPLILMVGHDKTELAVQRKKLQSLAWNKDLAGQFIYASALDSDNLNAVQDIASDATGIYFVAPDTFGMNGKVVGSLLKPDGSIDEHKLRKHLAAFQPPRKDHRQHVQAGFQIGLRWETAIPVTDRNALKAANRLWSSKSSD